MKAVAETKRAARMRTETQMIYRILTIVNRRVTGSGAGSGGGRDKRKKQVRISVNHDPCPRRRYHGLRASGILRESNSRITSAGSPTWVILRSDTSAAASAYVILRESISV